MDVLLVSLGNKDYILDFELIKHESGKLSGYDIVFNMLSDLLERLGEYREAFKKYCRISLDGWYGRGNMFVLLTILGLGRVEENQVVGTK